MGKVNTKETTPPCQIRLFGAFDVQINGVAMPPLRSRKVQWLLALLVLRHPQALDRAWLAGILWPDSIHTQALYNLRQSLSNLRQALGEAGSCLYASNVNALSLDLTQAAVDVLAFDAAIAAGDRDSLQRAIALYRGPLLEGCTEEWVFAERRVREESYLSALEKLAERAFAQGDGNAAVAYLRAFIQADPFREQAQRALMQALAAMGDYGAAVQTYRELRLMLHRELNADPDPQTLALFQKIRTEARSQAQVRPTPSLLPSSPPPRQLPSPLTALVGRKSAVKQAAAALRSVRLLTLTGPGGVGKTRLAIAVAEAVTAEYPEGVFFVDLAPISDPALIAQTVASAVQVAEEPGRPLLATLRDHLYSKTVLIILDNCEHLIEGCATLTHALLRDCPGASVLATSRQTLGLTGEVGWQVPPLSMPVLALLDGEKSAEKGWLSHLGEYESVELFVVRAQQAQPSFQMSARNAFAVAHICFHLDGLPLALELAAARVRSLSVEDILGKLDDRFRLLTGGSRAALPRQQTLRALMDWSYDLLNDTEKTLMGRLSVFAGGWTLQAAEQVCADTREEATRAASPLITSSLVTSSASISTLIEEWEVLDVLTSLVDKSLVQAEEQGGAVRYRMLETVRQYAAERLSLNGEAQTLKSRHRDYFLALAEEAEPNLMGSEQAMWLDHLEREHDNLRMALEWAPGETPQRLAGALWRFWMVRGYLSEGRERLTAALAQPEAELPTGIRAKTLSGAGTLARQQGDYASAQRFYEEGLAIRRKLADRPGVAASLGQLGTMAVTRGDYAAARELYEESLAIQRELGDTQSITGLLAGLGAVTYSQGDYVGARKYYEESLAMRRELRDKLGIARSLGALGMLAGSEGDYLSARGFFEESLAMRRDLGDKQGIAWSLENLGKIACALCDYALARNLHEESLAIQRELGDKAGVAGSLSDLGTVAYGQGDHMTAQSLYRESLALRQALADPQGITESLESFARLATASGLPERAVLFWAANTALRETQGTPREPKDREDYLCALHALRESLTDQVFADLWTKGQSMPLEQAVALALESTQEIG